MHAYGEDPLWVALGPHVGVVDLLENHPRLVVFPVLQEKRGRGAIYIIVGINKNEKHPREGGA